jgi:hypothetical protein
MQAGAKDTGFTVGVKAETFEAFESLPSSGRSASSGGSTVVVRSAGENDI